jgi:catechol 2,3-dioxygenase-like lactoylglutathione lyase family enzyme
VAATHREIAVQGVGGPPKSGWAKLAPELLVSDIEASLGFWSGILGFEIAYQRPDEKFVYLEHPEGHQIMLCQRHGRWETGPLERPFGRGVMFQLYFESIEPPLVAVVERNWPIHQELREIWRRAGSQETGQREFFLLDPDGYLIMVAQNLGERPINHE